MDLSDSHHFRKMVAGVCMVVAPILTLIAFVIGPEIETDAGPQLAAAADDLDAYVAANLFGLAAVALLVPAVLGLMHMLREKRVAYGHVGGGLALLGLLATMASIGLGFFVWQMAHGGVSAAEVTLLDDVNESTAVVLGVYVLGYGVGLGFIALAAGLYLARVVDWWMAAMIGLGPALINVAFAAGETAFAVVGSALLVVGLGSVGLMVLREPDADWEHTPEYRGFRPAAGTS
jgi:hypothetical protein